MTGLIEDMEAGRVGALVIRGVNPVYDRPDGAAFRGRPEQGRDRDRR